MTERRHGADGRVAGIFTQIREAAHEEPDEPAEAPPDLVPADSPVPAGAALALDGEGEEGEEDGEGKEGEEGAEDSEGAEDGEAGEAAEAAVRPLPGAKAGAERGTPRRDALDAGRRGGTRDARAPRRVQPT